MGMTIHNTGWSGIEHEDETETPILDDYLRSDGTKKLTGNWKVGNFDIKDINQLVAKEIGVGLPAYFEKFEIYQGNMLIDKGFGLLGYDGGDIIDILNFTSTGNIEIGSTELNTNVIINNTGGLGLNGANPSLFNNNANNLVIKGTSSEGLTIRAPIQCNIAATSSDGTSMEGLIAYKHLTDSWTFRTNSIDDRVVIDGNGDLYANKNMYVSDELYTNYLKVKSVLKTEILVSGWKKITLPGDNTILDTTVSSSFMISTETTSGGANYSLGLSSETFIVDGKEMLIQAARDGSEFELDDSVPGSANIYFFGNDSKVTIDKYNNIKLKWEESSSSWYEI